MATNFNDIVKQGYVKMKSRKLGVRAPLLGPRRGDGGAGGVRRTWGTQPNIGHVPGPALPEAAPAPAGWLASQRRGQRWQADGTEGPAAPGYC